MLFSVDVIDMSKEPDNFFGQKLEKYTIYGIEDPTFGDPEYEHFSIHPHYGMYDGIYEHPTYGKQISWWRGQPLQRPNGSIIRRDWGDLSSFPISREFRFTPVKDFAKKYPDIPKPTEKKIGGTRKRSRKATTKRRGRK